MPSFELATSPVALPAWALAVAVTLFVIVGVLVLTRAGAGFAGAILRVVVVIGGFAAAWLLLEQGAQGERSAERRGLEQRLSELATRAIAPGSSLGCLDALAGEAVETACEKQIFASPDSVAAAVSYVSARLSLLADAVAFARRGGERYESEIATMRLALETDRFGLVAHVLSVRDSCTPLLCDSYALFRDPDRVQANLREGVFDHYVERYAAEWATRTQPGVAQAAPGNTYTTASAPTAAAAPTPASPSKFDFPSAASIPAVSIMTAEPGAPTEPKTATVAPAAAAAPPLPPTPPRHVAHPLHPAHPPARATTAAPQQIAPPPQQIAPAATIASPGPSFR
ncbi:MAG TPA: hypothetical protein VKX28_25585 [Xanthobacteraceae bacterium]|nr:hypothetical protein [Xanthobacteraceae bacterium]